MGRDIAFETPHGTIGGWRADPTGAARGAVVVVQDIFGVNDHIRAVCDRFAAEGFTALAPAIFDLVEADVELPYDDAGTTRGRELAREMGLDRAADVIASAAQVLAGDGLRPAVVGFCLGGTLAFLANTRHGLAAVSYYGARTVPFLSEPLRAPMQFHFGAEDATIPAADIEAHRAALPDAGIHVYPSAGHAFNRDVDDQHHDAAAAALAHRRTLAFLQAAPANGSRS